MAGIKRKKLLVILGFCLLLLLSGCGRQEAAQEPSEFMAWSFARGLVRSRLDQPNKAIFPQFAREFVEQPEADLFIVRAHVGAPDENDNMVNFYFTVTAKYLGNQVFQETAVEISRAR